MNSVKWIKKLKVIEYPIYSVIYASTLEIH
jgi:hypothetical protein